jgi:hypothetical protein
VCTPPHDNLLWFEPSGNYTAAACELPFLPSDVNPTARRHFAVGDHRSGRVITPAFFIS